MHMLLSTEHLYVSWIEKMESLYRQVYAAARCVVEPCTGCTVERRRDRELSGFEATTKTMATAGKESSRIRDKHAHSRG